LPLPLLQYLWLSLACCCRCRRHSLDLLLLLLLLPLPLLLLLLLLAVNASSQLWSNGLRQALDDAFASACPPSSITLAGHSFGAAGVTMLAPRVAKYMQKKAAAQSSRKILPTNPPGNSLYSIMAPVVLWLACPGIMW
jgi:hypothetical protein